MQVDFSRIKIEYRKRKVLKKQDFGTYNPLSAFGIDYPNNAGFKVSGTSQAAAESIDAKTMQGKMLDLFKTQKLTSDEAGKLLNLDKITARARASELKAQGLIKETGEKRKNESGRMANVLEIV